MYDCMPVRIAAQTVLEAVLTGLSCAMRPMKYEALLSAQCCYIGFAGV